MQRKDRRTLEEFKKDIKDSSKEQAVIISEWLESTNQDHLKYWDCGSDNSGKYISNTHDVSRYPDYEVEQIGLIEVQYANPMCEDFFHIKHKKLLTCADLYANILMVNGWKTADKQFTLISPKQTKVLSARCRIVSWYGGGSKEAFKIPVKWFKWEKFKCQISATSLSG